MRDANAAVVAEEALWFRIRDRDLSQFHGVRARPTRALIIYLKQ